MPDWVEAIGPGSLVIVDEAGMAGTLELAAVIDYATARGASVRLVGDDRQLAAVGAGGVLRDIDRTHGAVTLSEVRRFTHADGTPNHAEAAASLAIRRGEPAGLGYYLDHGRIHVGDDTTTADQAFAAWSADRAAGLDTLLIASTNAQVRELNLRAQAARLAAAAVPAGRRVDARRRNDGQRRRRDHHPPQRPSPHPVGHRLGRQRRPLDRHLGPSRRRTRGPAHAVPQARHCCPPTTSPEHVQLGYACTVHAAQGQTVDTSHTVLTGSESRQLLYVALTRGRRANSLYLDVSVSGDDVVVRRRRQRPPTAVEMLTRVVERDDSAVSASSARREERDPVPLLRKACAEYARRARRGCRIRPRTRGPRPDRGARRRHRPRHHRLAGLASAQHAAAAARPRRRRAVPGAARRGDARPSRRHPRPRRRPRRPPRRPPTQSPDRCPGCHPSRASSPKTTSGVATSTAATNSSSATAPPSAPPRHAGRPRTHPPGPSRRSSDPDLTRDLATWRAAREIPDTDLRPTGPPANGRASSRHQRQLDGRLAEAGGAPITLQPAAARLAEAIHPGITADPHWPTLARQIAAAERVGIDRAELRRIATSRPLPIEEPAAALAYRLIDAIGERPASALPTAVSRRLYEPAPRPTPRPAHDRPTGPTPTVRSAPRR